MDMHSGEYLDQLDLQHEGDDPYNWNDEDDEESDQATFYRQWGEREREQPDRIYA